MDFQATAVPGLVRLAKISVVELDSSALADHLSRCYATQFQTAMRAEELPLKCYKLREKIGPIQLAQPDQYLPLQLFSPLATTFRFDHMLVHVSFIGHVCASDGVQKPTADTATNREA